MVEQIIISLPTGVVENHRHTIPRCLIGQRSTFSWLLPRATPCREKRFAGMTEMVRPTLAHPQGGKLFPFLQPQCLPGRTLADDFCAIIVAPILTDQRYSLYDVADTNQPRIISHDSDSLPVEHLQKHDPMHLRQAFVQETSTFRTIHIPDAQIDRRCFLQGACQCIFRLYVIVQDACCLSQIPGLVLCLPKNDEMFRLKQQFFFSLPCRNG